eukprot:3136971-Prymnesium_polylepis.1
MAPVVVAPVVVAPVVASPAVAHRSPSPLPTPRFPPPPCLLASVALSVAMSVSRAPLLPTAAGDPRPTPRILLSRLRPSSPSRPAPPPIPATGPASAPASACSSVSPTVWSRANENCHRSLPCAAEPAWEGR